VNGHNPKGITKADIQKYAAANLDYVSDVCGYTTGNGDTNYGGYGDSGSGSGDSSYGNSGYGGYGDSGSGDSGYGGYGSYGESGHGDSTGYGGYGGYGPSNTDPSHYDPNGPYGGPQPSYTERTAAVCIWHKEMKGPNSPESPLHPIADCPTKNLDFLTVYGTFPV
jgi:hypothetical protein